MSINEVNKVYSNDGKIYVGMQVREAGQDKELLACFNFADKDGNGEISEKEMVRYNGPLVKSNGVDYYPGLQIEDIDLKERETFYKLDLNRDGNLSEDEMKTVEMIKQDKGNMQKKLDRKSKIIGSAGCLGALGSLFGGIFYDCQKMNDWGLVVGLVGAVGSFLLADGIASGKVKKEISNLLEKYDNHPYAQELANELSIRYTGKKYKKD